MVVKRSANSARASGGRSTMSLGPRQSTPCPVRASMRARAPSRSARPTAGRPPRWSMRPAASAQAAWNRG
eukprot:10704603-Lingulodinium_polyedra.AAC.1